ncbi:uncharacterized protein LOC124897968 [Capsicum annuum]|uniref:uncharacterized protein LOC124897968 n=1 Tax=Capsicum annuum TaxID=4072 RepID=UPI001FB0D016|nr:uncharacterized protein LOC124897968 [Capsicum annuum]
MAPFKALYGMWCHSLIGWFETSKVRPFVTDLLQESLDKVKVIKEKLRAAQIRKKAYLDQRHRTLGFGVGDWVFLRVSPMKDVMKFGKKGKLHPIYTRPFKILRKLVRRDSIQLDKQWTFVEEPVLILASDVKWYSTNLVADIRARMRKFTSRLSRDLILESKIALLIKDIDISRLVIHLQQVEEEKKKWVEFGERIGKRSRFSKQSGAQQQSGRDGGKWPKKN